MVLSLWAESFAAGGLLFFEGNAFFERQHLVGQSSVYCADNEHTFRLSCTSQRRSLRKDGSSPYIVSTGTHRHAHRDAMLW